MDCHKFFDVENVEERDKSDCLGLVEDLFERTYAVVCLLVGDGFACGPVMGFLFGTALAWPSNVVADSYRSLLDATLHFVSKREAATPRPSVTLRK